MQELVQSQSILFTINLIIFNIELINHTKCYTCPHARNVNILTCEYIGIFINILKLYFIYPEININILYQLAKYGFSTLFVANQATNCFIYGLGEIFLN